MSILEFLQNTQNPFQWGLEKLLEGDEKRNIVDSLKEAEPWISDYMRYCSNLIMAHIYAIRGNLKDAQAVLENCEHVLSGDERFVKTYRQALEHILYSSKAQVALLSDEPEEALKIIERVPCFETLNQCEQAAVWGTRANITIKYYRKGTLESVEYAKKAHEVCYHEPEWHLLMGKLLMRIRHFKHPSPPPSENEINHFELGFMMVETPTFAVFLAGAYADYSLAYYDLYHREKSKEQKELAETYRQKAYDTYKKCIELNKGVCPNVMIRCARGLMRFRNDFECRCLANDLMYMALEKAPSNCMVNHYAGIICKKLKMFEEAQKYLNVSLDGGCLIAAFTLDLVEFNLNPNFSIDNFYEQLLDKFSKETDQAAIYLNITIYKLFKENNFVSALTSFTKVLQLDETLEELKSTWPKWISTDKQVNLIKLFANDIQYELDKYSHCYSKMELEDMEGLLKLLKQIAPEEVNAEVKCNMLANILASSSNTFAKSSNRLQRGARGTFRGRRMFPESHRMNSSDNLYRMGYSNRNYRGGVTPPTLSSGQFSSVVKSSAPTRRESWRTDPRSLAGPSRSPSGRQTSLPKWETNNVLKIDRNNKAILDLNNSFTNEMLDNESREISLVELKDAIDEVDNKPSDCVQGKCDRI